MILIFTLDEQNGTQFAGKRQSTDRALADNILEVAGNRLYMKATSQGFFANATQPNSAHIVTDFADVPTDAYIFAEEVVPASIMDAAEKIYVYRWNRRYPSFTKDRVDLAGYQCYVENEFPGNSHEKITMEVYFQ